MSRLHVLLVPLLLLAIAAPALAAYPGQNGALIVTRTDLQPGATPVPEPPGPYPTPTPPPAATQSGIYAVDPGTGEATSLGVRHWAGNPSAGADGRTIVFVASGGISFVAPGLYGDLATTIPPGSMFASNPALSPDGTRVLFDSPRTQEADGYAGSDVYVVNTDGSGLRRLVDGQGARAPTWSPDGSRVAFAGWADRSLQGSPDIYTVAADGSDLRNVTNSPEQWEDAPDWSPDGSRIAYAGPDDIETIAVGGTDVAPVGPGRSPSWSPDGTRIAAVRPEAGFRRYEVVTYPATGGAATVVTTDPRFSDDTVSWARVPDPLPAPTPSAVPSAAPTPAPVATAGERKEASVDARAIAAGVRRTLAGRTLRRLLRGTPAVRLDVAGTARVRVLRGRWLLASGSVTGPGVRRLRLRRTLAGRQQLRRRPGLKPVIQVTFRD